MNPVNNKLVFRKPAVEGYHLWHDRRLASGTLMSNTLRTAFEAASVRGLQVTAGKKMIQMAWGVEFESTFGQFGPQNDFVGWYQAWTQCGSNRADAKFRQEKLMPWMLETIGGQPSVHAS